MKIESAYEAALAELEPNDDGGFDEKRLVELIASKISIDETEEKRRKAQHIVNRRKRPGQTPPDGQLVLFDFPAEAYEPHRLIADNDGHVVELQNARPAYMQAQALRQQKKAQRALDLATAEVVKSAAYAAWAMDQLRRRRRGSDITVGIWVRETGIWQPGEAPPLLDPDDPDDVA